MGFFLNDNRVSGGGILEADTVHCRHCQGVVLMQHRQAQGSFWCYHCQGPVCFNLACQECKHWKQKVDEQLTRAERLRQMLQIDPLRTGSF